MRRGIPRTRNKDGVPVCFRGHLMTPKNTYNRPGSTNNPQCRECKRLRGKDNYELLRAHDDGSD